MARKTYTFRNFFIHAVLLFGCAVFAFPFVWLLSTSAKTNEELGVFPPRWVPAVPWYAEQSPFVDGAAYDPMEPPRDMPAKEWEDVHVQVEDTIWRQCIARLGETKAELGFKPVGGPAFLTIMHKDGHIEDRTIWISAEDRLLEQDEALSRLNGEWVLDRVRSQVAGSDLFRDQMIRGVWSQVRDIVPDKPTPAQFRAFVDGAVTPAMVDRCWDRAVRRLAVRGVEVRHVNDDIVPPREVEAWEGIGAATLTADTVEGKPARLVHYDFREADRFTLRTTLRLPEALEDLRCLRVDPLWTPWVPVPPGRAAGPVSVQGPYLWLRGETPVRVGALSIPIHCDGSWHRAEITLETGGTVYRGERPLWMDIRTWQEAELLFQPPAFLGSRAIVLAPDPKATTDLRDPHAYRLTMTFEKSSRLGAAWNKYIDSYRWALRYIPFDTQLRNSVILVVLNVLGQLFACSLVAYGFARLEFFGRGFLFALLLATMMLPGQVTMIPQFVLWKDLGWYNTLRPLWVPSWFGAAFFIFLMRQFFMTIPKELEDAAKIDGCGFFGIYWRIFLPLAAPAMATVAIFSFMGAWNEFVGPLVYLSDERLFPLALGLNQFRQEQSGEWAWMMAASTLMMLPVVAVFFFCQRYFIQGVTLTGIKG